MKPVVIESPYAGDVETHKAYLKRCVIDCLSRNESPYASHAFFTQFLDDTIPNERKQGIDAGFVWAELTHTAVFYIDYGMSNGMMAAHNKHINDGKTVIIREIGKNPPKSIGDIYAEAFKK